MPSLPEIGDYQQRVDFSEPYRKITPSATPDPTGGALEQLGNEWAEGKDRLQSAVIQKNRADGAVYAANQMAGLRTRMAANLESAKQSVADDGQGFTGAILDQYDKESQTLLEAAKTNPFAAKALDQGLKQYRAQVAEHALNWEAQAGIAYRSNSIKKNVDSLASVVESDPSQYQSAGNEQVFAIHNSALPPEQRLQLGNYLDDTLTRHAAIGMARQDPLGVMNQLKDPSSAGPIISHLKPDQIEQLRSFAQGQYAQSVGDPIVDTFRGQGPQAGATALKAVDALNQPDDVKSLIYKHVQDGLSTWHAEARQTNGSTIEALEERLASGKVNANDKSVVMGLWHNGAFDAAQAGETAGRIDRAQEKRVKDDIDLRNAMDAYQAGGGAGGRSLDPEHDKEAVNSLFNTMTTNVQTGSQEWINRAADISAKLGVTPYYALDWSRSQLVSGQPKDAAAAADAIQRLQDSNPRGLGFAIDPKTKAMAQSINDAVAAGTDPAIAVQHARQISQQSDGLRDGLEEQYKALKTKSGAPTAPGALNAELKNDPRFAKPFMEHIPGFGKDAPTVPPEMVGQFEELRKNYYSLTNGNLAQANDLAYADMKNTWGMSEINGKREYMQFAPETMNPGLTTEYLREDMEKSAALAQNAALPDSQYMKLFAPDAEGQFFGAPPDADYSKSAKNNAKVRLIASAETYHSNGQQWHLGTLNKYGAYDTLVDKSGNPILYQLPTASASIRANEDKQKAEGMQRLSAAQQRDKLQTQALDNATKDQQELGLNWSL